MSQFLLVQGRDPGAVRALHERGVAAFGRIHGAGADSVAGGDRMRVAHFGRAYVPGAPLVETPAAGEWALTAGTWVAGDGSSGAAAVRGTGSGLLAGGDASAAALRALDGYFVAAAGHAGRNEAVVATDRIGALHAYTAESEGCALVSTSALVLAAVTGAAVDRTAAREMLAAHSVFESRSLFAGVEKLPAATVVRLRDGEVVARHAWWTLADACWDRAAAEADPGDLADALVETVRGLLAAHPRPVFDLTGGFDSRILVGAALRTGLPFATVVNGVATDENVVAANRIAAAFGLDHRNQVPGRDFPEPEFEHFRRVCALGDGEANVFDYGATMLAHTALARRFDLAVNGSFGEVCRGYWWDLSHSWMRTRRRFDPRAFAASRFPGTEWADRIAPSLGRGPVREHFAGIVARTVADLGGLPDTARGDAVYVRVRMHRWHGRIASMIDRLRPTAAPFAFRAPLEAALSMRPSVRRGGRCARDVVEILDARLARMPLANGAAALPIRLTNLHLHAPHFAELAGRATRRVLRRPAVPKRPPVWRAGDVWRLEEVADLLDPAAMRTRDLYDAAVLRELLDACRRERAAPPATLGRIATIELAARAVAAARASVPEAVRA